MKKSLQLASGIVILYFSGLTISGQTILLTENFSGFSTGTHTTPSTSDASSSLDSKTNVLGWTGFMIYPAGGEIKIGTSSATGWIETPSVDLSANGGKFNVVFDISRWSGDATTVQVYLNGIAIGNIITPSDAFQNVQITGTNGNVSSKIKIQALTKRFFLDNFAITTENITTGDMDLKEPDEGFRVFPVPVIEELTINNVRSVNIIEIFDITGRKVISLRPEANDAIKIPVHYLSRGLYLLRVTTSEGVKIIKFLKS